MYICVFVFAFVVVYTVYLNLIIRSPHRLVRLVRLVKLYKAVTERRKRAREEAELMELVQIGAMTMEDIEKTKAMYNDKQSRLGSQLSESTTKRVIVIVLIMLCVLPVISIYDSNIGPQYATSLLEAVHYLKHIYFKGYFCFYN